MLVDDICLATIAVLCATDLPEPDIDVLAKALANINILAQENSALRGLLVYNSFAENSAEKQSSDL